MWNNNDPHQTVILPPSKGFLTPSPASGNPKASFSFSPMTETKRISSPATKRDLFHVIHKVPSGDSPYVRAKHVQLIEKDPSRAVSLFWSAINAGDRVDSALKDMAIVMKQLNRSDEAIEAIKSFRHLCPVDSQESLDNVLVELYKRAGRIEEEIEMLQRKLQRIEEGSAFGGRKTKTARSQGKKVHISVDEEKSRILGNLAWAYLQQSNYKAAEEYYRKALMLEPDMNKQCNLAICLMNMNRSAEAKSLLRAVKLLCGAGPMDESFAKSFERAWEMLTELDPKSALEEEPSAKETGRRRNVPTSLPSPTVGPRSWEAGKRRVEADREFYCGNNFENKAKSRDIISAFEGMSLKCLQQPMTVDQLKSGFFEEMSGERRPDFAKRRTELETESSWRRKTDLQASYRQRKERFSPAPFTQPRRCLWGFGDGDQRKQKVDFGNPRRNFSSDDDWRKSGYSENIDAREGNSSQEALTEEKFLSATETPSNAVDSSSVCNKKKSWADMAEEEENEDELCELAREFFNSNEKFDLYESPCLLQTQTKNALWSAEKEEFDDENTDMNIGRGSDYRLQTQMKNVARKLEDCCLSEDSSSSKSQSVRRSLFSGQDEGKNSIRLLRRNNRLKVFQDITQSP